MPLSSIQVCSPLGNFTSTLIKKTLPADNREISLVFLGSYAHAYTPLSQRHILIVSQWVCHFEDEMTRDRSPRVKTSGLTQPLT